MRACYDLGQTCWLLVGNEGMDEKIRSAISSGLSRGPVPTGSCSTVCSLYLAP